MMEQSLRSSSTRFYLLAVLIVAGVDLASGIRCYYCNYLEAAQGRAADPGEFNLDGVSLSAHKSEQDGRQDPPPNIASCKSNPPSSTLRQCQAQYKTCAALYGVFSNKGTTFNAWIRGCAEPYWPTQGCRDGRQYWKEADPRLDKFYQSGTACFCSTDGCNTGAVGGGGGGPPVGGGPSYPGGVGIMMTMVGLACIIVDTIATSSWLRSFG